LAQSHDAHAGGATEPDVQVAIEKLFIAVEEGVVKGNADFVSVQ